MITKDSSNMCWFFWDAMIFCNNFMLPKQPYATHPLFLDNLHFEHFVKSVNFKSRLNYLTISSKWRLSKKGYEWHTAAPNEDFGGRTNLSECVFEALFNVL